MKTYRIRLTDGTVVRMLMGGSSTVYSIGYEAGNLYVALYSGSSEPKLYEYFDVPSELWDGLQHAVSWGRYFGQSIRGKFSERKHNGYERFTDAVPVELLTEVFCAAGNTGWF